jgi:signal transduction histidine kinase
VYGDENRVTQILLNFLSNAFKMTKSGGNITVEVKAIDGDNQAFSKLPEASID